MTRSSRLLFGAVLLLGNHRVASVTAATSDLVITELLASNDAGLVDEDGESSDWLEVYNSGGVPVNLVGLTLTDDATVPNAERWTFPSVELAPMAYLVVFASGEDRRMDDGSELHTDFRLGAGGEYLGLADAAGGTISEYRPGYPPQSTDVSYGIDSTGNLRFFSTPTPGVANGVGDPQRVEAVVTSSMERGFYDAAIAVELEATTTASPLMSGLEIRYTTDGSEPTATSGIVYTRSSGPIAISTTTVLRAAVFADNSLPSPTSTYTYVFLDDVLQQPAAIPGFPNGMLQATGNRGLPLPQEFAMDPAIVAEYAAEIHASMKSIPTISISAATDNLFATYFSDDDVETKCSMEVLKADSPDENEQIDVGVETHSRNRQKRFLRLNFRSDYGNREWVTPFFKNNAPLNSESATNTHRTLILRAGSNRSWARSTSEPFKVAYTIDEFYRASQIAMTGVGSRGTFVHLYLNGAYWGLYNLVERPDEQFQAQYFGGDDDDYFYTNHGGAGSADSTRWDYLIGPLARKDLHDPVNYAEMEEYLNLERFADYMILNFYVGMTDWPDNNWYVANRNDASPLGPTGSEFYAWDGEFCLDRKERSDADDGAGIPDDFINDNGLNVPILLLWHALFATEDFQALFDERVQFHTRAAGGALSDAMAIQRWDTLNAYIRSAVVGESARWGDSLENLGDGNSVPTRTRDVHWQNQVDKIRDLLEGNTQLFLDEYTKLVNPSLFAKLSAKFPALRNFFTWLDGKGGLFSKWF